MTLSDLFGVTSSKTLFQPAISAGTWICTECGDVRNIMFLRDAHSEYDISYIACPDCGPTRLNPSQISQRSLETVAVLERLFADTRQAIQPLVADRPWKIGRRFSWTWRVVQPTAVL